MCNCRSEISRAVAMLSSQSAAALSCGVPETPATTKFDDQCAVLLLLHRTNAAFRCGCVQENGIVRQQLQRRVFALCAAATVGM